MKTKQVNRLTSVVLYLFLGIASTVYLFSGNMYKELSMFQFYMTLLFTALIYFHAISTFFVFLQKQKKRKRKKKQIL